MFSNKSKLAQPSPGGTTSIIGAGVTLTGDVNSPGDIRIDGYLKGNIICTSRVFIGADGFVEGNIEGVQADVMGKVKGNMKTKELLNLRANAVITGDIYAGKLQVEPTVSFNGRCFMNTKGTAGNQSVDEIIKEINEQPTVHA